MNELSEIIKLPSRGLVYSKDSALSSGEIEMRYMTAKDEDILTNRSYLENGLIIDKLLQSLIITKIDYDELIEGDKDTILISARILGYGKDYEFDYIDPNTREKRVGKIDLTTVQDKEIDESLFTEGKNDFEFKSPVTSNVINFKLLTHGDSKKIDAEVKGLLKITPKGSFESSTRLKYIITGINGKRDTKIIREFVDKEMLASEARALRKYINEMQPGIDLKYYPEDTEEGINIPIGITFLWPDFGL